MSQSKVILGIDPGFTSAGYALVKIENLSARLIDIGTVSQKKDHSITTKIGTFFEFFEKLCNNNAVSMICIETPFLGKNIQTFLKLGYLRGVLNLLSHQKQIALHEYSPREIKSAITGYGHADKEQVKKALHMMIPNLIGLTEKLKFDATDALAIALCGVMHKDSTTNK